MQETPPKFLYFDLGNVLVHFDHSLLVDQLATLVDADAATVRQVVFDSGLQAEYECGRIGTAGFCQRIRDATGARATDAEIGYACSNIFWVNAGIFPLVTALRAVNYPIGILSNTCPAHWDFLLESVPVLWQLFHKQVLSFREGCSKPDPAIYTRAAEHAGALPHEVFLVDDLPANVDGARQAGLDAVLFTSTRQLASDLRQRGVPFNG